MRLPGRQELACIRGAASRLSEASSSLRRYLDLVEFLRVPKRDAGGNVLPDEYEVSSLRTDDSDAGGIFTGPHVRIDVKLEWGSSEQGGAKATLERELSSRLRKEVPRIVRDILKEYFIEAEKTRSFVQRGMEKGRPKEQENNR
jgi:hypothetical protein